MEQVKLEEDGGEKCGMTDEISSSSQESSTLGGKCDSGILPRGIKLRV